AVRTTCDAVDALRVGDLPRGGRELLEPLELRGELGAAGRAVRVLDGGDERVHEVCARDEAPRRGQLASVEGRDLLDQPVDTGLGIVAVDRAVGHVVVVPDLRV